MSEPYFLKKNHTP